MHWIDSVSSPGRCTRWPSRICRARRACARRRTEPERPHPSKSACRDPERLTVSSACLRNSFTFASHSVMASRSRNDSIERNCLPMTICRVYLVSCVACDRVPVLGVLRRSVPVCLAVAPSRASIHSSVLEASTLANAPRDAAAPLTAHELSQGRVILQQTVVDEPFLCVIRSDVRLVVELATKVVEDFTLGATKCDRLSFVNLRMLTRVYKSFSAMFQRLQV